ncbi:unnamed protein product [Calicophoron daubneyi]|uniref:Major facilitator superfamily (MFS) profile domain-containing protein n=1 Tax=Calicophoron daubneyi TaxID=300641 RepID=A0AAV2TFP4_CALDB
MNHLSKDRPFEFVPLNEQEADDSSKPLHTADFDDEVATVTKDKGEPANAMDKSTYTAEEAVEAAGFGCYQFRLCVVCGILWSADAMEMLLLSILGPALRCQWNLPSQQIAAITTVVFVGYLIGSPIWGFMSDKFGRWPIFMIVLSMICYFGLLTAVSPTYVWVLILRFTVGFAIGGGSSSICLLMEYLPVKSRAKVQIGNGVFWAFGSTFEVGLAYLLLPRFGWRWVVFATAVPLALFLFLLKFLPESLRYLVTAGRTEEAEEVLRQMFTANKVQPLDGRLVAPKARKRGNIKDFFSKTYLATTLLLPLIWFCAAFSYYGVVLLSAEIFRFRHDCFGNQNQSSNFQGEASKLDSSCCAELTNDDYVAMLISSVGEFVNIPLLIVSVDCLGRKLSMGIWYGVTGISFFMLYICMPKEVMTGVMFVLRSLSSGLLTLVYLYTSEVYPTTVRAVALGMFSSIARLGAMSTPYVAQVMMPEVSQIGALSLYAGISLVCSFLCFFLPIETLGRQLSDSTEDSAHDRAND